VRRIHRAQPKAAERTGRRIGNWVRDQRGLRSKRKTFAILNRGLSCATGRTEARRRPC
jgi:hypothetical protein